MIWIDEQFINRISFRLERFKKVKNYLYNFRCPICGDSKKSKSKTRGYFYVKGGSDHYNFACHNGCDGKSFSNFLKDMDENLYQEYIMDRFKFRNDNSTQIQKNPISLKVIEDKNESFLDQLVKISDLPTSNLAKRYLILRKIPLFYHERIYYAENFVKWASQIEPMDSKIIEHERVVIPYFDENGKPFRFISRSIDESSKLRYIQTSIYDLPRIYNMDIVNPNKTVYIVEGQFDSMFITNCVAVGSANYDIPYLNNYPDKVFVPDNQPRNYSVCREIKKLIDNGQRVVIWNFDWGKDINKMILNGHSKEEIQLLINQSTYQGVSAKMKFKQWVKCDV